MKTQELIYTRADLARLIPSNGRAVELGVASGEFSKQLLERNTGFRLVSVDAWADPQRGHDDAEYELACVRLSYFGNRSIIMRKTFAEATHFFPYGSLDFVYVDGYAHTGQEDGRTLYQWWPRVKAGGIFAGHDYHRDWPETVKQVERFCHKMKLQPRFTSQDQYPSWWVVK